MGGEVLFICLFAWYFTQEEVREQALKMREGRTFQAEGAASVKVPRGECVHLSLWRISQETSVPGVRT